MAIIAIARKVIILDIKAMDSLSLIGIAAIIIALTLGYFFMKRSQSYGNKSKIEDTSEEFPQKSKLESI